MKVTIPDTWEQVPGASVARAGKQSGYAQTGQAGAGRRPRGLGGQTQRVRPTPSSRGGIDVSVSGVT